MHYELNMTFLPININITDHRILIIGGGRVGLHKATILHRFTDEATVISPEFQKGFSDLPFTLVKKAYEPSDLDGAHLVYICTENHELNAQIKRDAEERHVLASVCDNPELCDFTSPAIYKDGDLLVAVSSNAKNVHLSIQTRDDIANFLQHKGSVTLTTCYRLETYWGEGDIPTDTARHLFRVAAGLESPLLGEKAILGQLKSCYQEASEKEKLSPSINRLFQYALHVGHRVRTETGISRGAVSYSQVTVDLLCREMPDLTGKVVSIIGVNELTESVLNFLSARGATNIVLANRSLAKAEALAEKYGAEAMPLTDKKKLLELSDVVITATSAPHAIIKAEDISRKVLIFDLASPADVDEAVKTSSETASLVRLYQLADVERLAQQNLQKRQAEVRRCEEIIEEEIAELKRWQEKRKCYYEGEA